MLFCSDDCVIFSCFNDGLCDCLCGFNDGLCGFNGGLCGGCVVDDEENKHAKKKMCSGVLLFFVLPKIFFLFLLW